MFLRFELRLGKPRKLKSGKAGKQREKKIGVLSCDYCSDEFERYIKQRDISRKHFCSKSCKSSSKKPGGCLYLANGGFQKSETIKSNDFEPYELLKRTKNCTNCNMSFIDITKKVQKKNCCIECSRSLGVKVRNKNGSYSRTQEMNIAVGNTLRLKHKTGEIKVSDENKRKNSIFMKEHWTTGNMKEKITKTCQERYGEDHWTQTKMGRKKLSDMNSGRTITEETRDKMSRSASLRVLKNPLKTRGRGGIRKDLDCYFRSSWEANVARVLTYLDLSWEFEPDSFKLPTGKHYIPDFLITAGEWKIYLEVKGYIDDDGMGKWREFCLINKDIDKCKCLLIDGIIYKKLVNNFSHLQSWETR